MQFGNRGRSAVVRLQPVLNQGALSEADVFNLFGSEGVFRCREIKCPYGIQPIRIQQQVQGYDCAGEWLEKGGGWTDVEKDCCSCWRKWLPMPVRKTYQAEILASRDNLQSFF